MKRNSQKKRIGNHPVLVRFDKDALSKIDQLKRYFGHKSRPQTIRFMVAMYGRQIFP